MDCDVAVLGGGPGGYAAALYGATAGLRIALVEEQRVRRHEEDAGERHAHLPSARERADVAVHHLLAEAEAGEEVDAEEVGDEDATPRVDRHADAGLVGILGAGAAEVGRPREARAVRRDLGEEGVARGAATARRARTTSPAGRCGSRCR